MEFSILGHLPNCIYTFMFIHKEGNGRKGGEREKGSGEEEEKRFYVCPFSKGQWKTTFYIEQGENACF